MWNSHNEWTNADTQDTFIVELKPSNFREKMNGSVIKVNETGLKLWCEGGREEKLVLHNVFQCLYS